MLVLATSNYCEYEPSTGGNYSDTCTSVLILNTTTQFPSEVFKDNSKLKKVDFQADSILTVVRQNVFAGLTLTSPLELPKSITSIEQNIFKNSILQSLTFEPLSIITTFDEQAFELSTVLTSVELPASIENIQGSTFLNANWPEISFETGSKLTTLEGGAFNALTSTRIKLPPSIENINYFGGIGAFTDCHITELCFEENNTELTGAHSFAFYLADVETLILNRPGNYTFNYSTTVKNLFATDFVTLEICGTEKAYTNVLYCEETDVIWAENCTINSAFTTTIPPSTSSTDDSSLAIIIGSVVGGVALITIIVLGILYL